MARMNRKLTRWSCAAGGVALAASCLAGTMPAGAARAGSSGPGAALPVYGVLHGVAAVSAADAWAVGHQFNLNILTLHWNGRAWKQVPSPSLPGNLLSVAATSTRNVWAVGYTTSAGLIVHWNGIAWRRVPSPSRIGLVGVAATSDRNAWAVGQDSAGIAIVHWNGRAWKQVPSPNPPGAQLAGVAATSAFNAWAVGIWQPATGNRLLRTLILHWNGRAWKQVPSPNPPGNDELSGVAATSARDAWAVGQHNLQSTMILHWNGIAWKQVPSPSPPGAMLSVTAASARNAWASGTAIVHWNGTAWKPQAPGESFELLTGVTATSARNAWAVGYFCTAKCGQHTSFIVIVHWNGSAWKAETTLPARSG
jgi:hypothetical protein